MRLGVKRSGFTIVELLVAIAIISVLVGLLMPAVMYARAAARRVQCQSQMRQVGLAIDMYVDAQGQNGVYPWMTFYPSANPGMPTLLQALDRNVENNKMLFACPSDTYLYQQEGFSYEYPFASLSMKTRVQIKKDRPAETILILYDADAFHGPSTAQKSRNALYLDGHVEPL